MCHSSGVILPAKKTSSWNSPLVQGKGELVTCGIVDIAFNSVRRVSVDEQNINSAYGIFNSHYVVKKPVSFLQYMVIWDEADSAPGNMPKPLAVIVTYVFGELILRVCPVLH